MLFILLSSHISVLLYIGLQTIGSAIFDIIAVKNEKWSHTNIKICLFIGIGRHRLSWKQYDHNKTFYSITLLLKFSFTIMKDLSLYSLWWLHDEVTWSSELCNYIPRLSHTSWLVLQMIISSSCQMFLIIYQNQPTSILNASEWFLATEHVFLYWIQKVPDRQGSLVLLSIFILHC